MHEYEIRILGAGAAGDMIVEVLHLMHDAKLRPHVPTEGVRVTADGQLRYDATFV